jgi:hypothetical protein
MILLKEQITQGRPLKLLWIAENILGGTLTFQKIRERSFLCIIKLPVVPLMTETIQKPYNPITAYRPFRDC